MAWRLDVDRQIRAASIVRDFSIGGRAGFRVSEGLKFIFYKYFININIVDCVRHPALIVLFILRDAFTLVFATQRGIRRASCTPYKGHPQQLAQAQYLESERDSYIATRLANWMTVPPA
eukprot:1176223-Prorocentrum_minimum.AAC.5